MDIASKKWLSLCASFTTRLVSLTRPSTMKELKQLLADKRIRRTSESPPRFSIIDAIACATACGGSQAAHKFRRLQVAYPRLFARIADAAFSGQGQKPTPVCEEPELEKLFAALPGRVAQIFRTTGQLPTKRTERSTKDHLYIMHYSFCSTKVKIGRNQNVEARKKSFETGHDFHVEVVATFPGKGFLEPEVHKRLEHKRSKRGAGVEWFDISPEEAFACISSLSMEP